MGKYKLEAAVLQELKDECAGKGKVHLLRLKALANAYVQWYPGSMDLSGIDKMSPVTARKFLIANLCKNIPQLESKVDTTKPAPVEVKKAPSPKPIKLPSPKANVPMKPVAPILKKPYVAPPKPVAPKPAAPAASAKKEKLPIVKPAPSEHIPLIELKIQTKTADAGYLTSLKKQIAEIENKGYNMEALEKDIQNDEFIKQALDAHIQALEFKLKTYKKLGEVNWQGHVGGAPVGHTINLNEVIKKMEEEIKNKLKELKSNPNAIADKREEMMNILYDPDNGIATIRGSSRESVRIGMLKIIYMFIKVPVFFFKGFINFMLTGPAGSGKTKVASVIAHMMKSLGILATKKVTMATKQNLVAEFVGQSGPKTRSLLAGSIEGVVFIDEAYTLTPCPGSMHSNFSEEAVGELINFVDKFIGCLVVIVAGYKKKMYDCFLAFNEGMSRRFPKVVDLIPYNTHDMYEIFESFLGDSVDVKKVLTKDQRIFIKSIIAHLNNEKMFNNQAGDMLNLSKVIGEDAVLFGKEYDNEMIKLSFKKFCANKNIALEF